MEARFLSPSRTLVIKIQDEIDHHSSEAIRKRIDKEIQRYMPLVVVFDFSGVKFMDSSGIGMIIGRYKNIQRLNGKAFMTNVRPEIKRIFEMSGLFKIIPLCDNIEGTVKSV